MSFFSKHHNVVRRVVKIALDVGAFFLSLIVAYFLRFNPTEAILVLSNLGWLILIFIAIRLGTFFLFRLHSSIWRYGGTHDLLNILKASTVGTLIIVVVSYFLHYKGMSRLIIALDWLLVVFLTGGMRLSVRLLYETKDRFVRQSRQEATSDDKTNVLIYGAGRAGELLLRDINSAVQEGINVVGFVDDDKNKHGQYIHNRKVLGGAANIPEVINKYNVQEIFFAIASLSGTEARDLLTSIRETAGDQVSIKIIPGLQDLMHGRISVNQLRNIEIADLLRRKPVELDYDPVRQMIHGQVPIIVGGGGSIGSEICRQIALFNPRRLIVLDASEFNLYTTEMMLREQFPELDLQIVVGDATSKNLLKHTFEKYRPNQLFHAAAYKHVPLMEHSPWSAVYNNISTTLNLAEISREYEIERFVMISTDKAVHPTNVMGATKRICEEIVLANSANSKTDFMTVRFGNVLGSSGSVIPRFQKQIEQGGPVTVTHPQIKRYFMLISEAVELVLQAGAIGENGVCYVLDMGQPVPILELAKYMINLAGLKEGTDIRIEFTGLRPGEKLSEELCLVGEEIGTTIPGLMMLRQRNVKDESFLQALREFANNTYTYDQNQIRKKLQQFVPEYTPNQKTVPVGK